MRECIAKGISPNYGIYLIDSIDPQYNSKRRNRIIDYFTSPIYQMGRFKPKSPFMIYDPVFVDSEFHNLSQIADLVAFIIHRKLGSSGKSKIDTYCDKFFEVIKCKFDTNENNLQEYKNYGLKIYP